MHTLLMAFMLPIIVFVWVLAAIANYFGINDLWVIGPFLAGLGVACYKYYRYELDE